MKKAQQLKIYNYLLLNPNIDQLTNRQRNILISLSNGSKLIDVARVNNVNHTRITHIRGQILKKLGYVFEEDGKKRAMTMDEVAKCL